MHLPIDVVPGTTPPRFKWSRRVDSLVGVRDVPCEGCLPASVEYAVAELVELAKRQAAEIENHRKTQTQAQGRRGK